MVLLSQKRSATNGSSLRYILSVVIDDDTKAVARVSLVVLRNYTCRGRIAAQRGFIQAEIIILNGTAGGNGIAGGTLHQPALGVLLG